MLRNLLRDKKEKNNEKFAELRGEISEISEMIIELSKRQSELEEKLSQLSKEISQIREEVSENSKKIAMESSDRITAIKRTMSIVEEIELKKEKNRFIPVVKEMIEKEAKSIQESKEFNFVLAILKILPKKAAIDSPLSFWDLVNALWFDLYLIKKGFSRNDCRDALSAIIEFTDILEIRSQKNHPHRLFVFNEKSEFYWQWAPIFYTPSQK